MSGSAPAPEALLEQAVREIGIPPCPAVLARINAEMASPDPDPVRLGRIISGDVSLSAGIMRIANSPWFGLSARPRNVQQALMMLGMDIAARAAAGIALRNAFPRQAAMERFWDASARIAQIAGWLRPRLDLPAEVTQGDAYTFGLFRDSGIAVMMRRFEGYRDTLKLANESRERAFTEVESAHHPTNHALVGCMLARTWWMPETACLAIRHHHDIGAIASHAIALPPETAALIALAQFAEHALQRQSGLSMTQEWEKLGPHCLALLGLDETRAEEALRAAGEMSAHDD